MIEILIGLVLALGAWMLWNGMRPPGATVKSSLERERARRERAQRGPLLKLVLVGLPALSATLLDFEAFAAPLLG